MTFRLWMTTSTTVIRARFRLLLRKALATRPPTVAGVRALVDLVGRVVIVFLMCLGLIIAGYVVKWEASESALFIELQVPKELLDLGYDPPVARQRFYDALQARLPATAPATAPDFETGWSGPDLSLPGEIGTIDAASAYLRVVFDHNPPTLVHGEILREEDGGALALRLRINNEMVGTVRAATESTTDPDGDYLAACSSGPTSDSRAASRRSQQIHSGSSPTCMDTLFENGAGAVLKILDPIAYAQSLLPDAPKEALSLLGPIAVSGSPSAVRAVSLQGIVLAAVFEEDDNAIERFRAAIEIDPGFSPALYNWGVVLERMGNYDGAASRYMAAAATATERPEFADGVARTYHSWGRLLHRTGDYGEAVEKYAMAVGREPARASAYQDWGLSLVALDRREEAVEKYAQAVLIDPELTGAYCEWKAALRALGKPEEAEAVERRAARFDVAIPEHCE